MFWPVVHWVSQKAVSQALGGNIICAFHYPTKLPRISLPLPGAAPGELPLVCWALTDCCLFGASFTSMRGSKIFFFLVEKEGLYENFNSENGSERRRCKLACSPTSHKEAMLIWDHEQSACFFEQRTIPQGMVGFLGGFSTYSPCFFPYLPPAIRGHVEHLFLWSRAADWKTHCSRLWAGFCFDFSIYIAEDKFY